MQLIKIRKLTFLLCFVGILFCKNIEAQEKEKLKSGELKKMKKRLDVFFNDSLFQKIYDEKKVRVIKKISTEKRDDILTYKVVCNITIDRKKTKDSYSIEIYKYDPKKHDIWFENRNELFKLFQKVFGKEKEIYFESLKVLGEKSVPISVVGPGGGAGGILFLLKGKEYLISIVSKDIDDIFVHLCQFISEGLTVDYLSCK